jgi:hypothetical protein
MSNPARQSTPRSRLLFRFFGPAGFYFLSLMAAPAVALPDGTIPSNLGVQLKGPDMNAAALDKVKVAGFIWVRRGFIWDGIKKEGFTLHQESGGETPALKALKVLVAEISGYKLDKRPPTENPLDKTKMTNGQGRH